MNNNFYVNSNNQSGGITAGQINLGSPERELNENTQFHLKQDIKKYLINDRKLIIIVSNEPEALRFSDKVVGSV